MPPKIVNFNVDRCQNWRTLAFTHKLAGVGAGQGGVTAIMEMQRHFTETAPTATRASSEQRGGRAWEDWGGENEAAAEDNCLSLPPFPGSHAGADLADIYIFIFLVPSSHPTTIRAANLHLRNRINSRVLLLMNNKSCMFTLSTVGCKLP